MMVLTMGLYPAEVAAEAVSMAFREEGLLAEHVEVERIEGQPDAWRWRLREGAPLIVDGEITAFDVVEEAGRISTSNFHHLAISSGAVVETPEGWVVATAGEEAEMVSAARRHVFDLDMLRENADAGR